MTTFRLLLAGLAYAGFVLVVPWALVLVMGGK